jgi:protein FRG1
LHLREDGCALQSGNFGTFVQADTRAFDSIEATSGHVRGDSDSIGFKEIWKVKCQAQEKKRRLMKQREDLSKKVEVYVDPKIIEEEHLKKFHSFGGAKIRTVTTELTDEEVLKLRKAQDEGRLNEELLDRRIKHKTDKYC